MQNSYALFLNKINRLKITMKVAKADFGNLRQKKIVSFLRMQNLTIFFFYHLILSYLIDHHKYNYLINL